MYQVRLIDVEGVTIANWAVPNLSYALEVAVAPKPTDYFIVDPIEPIPLYIRCHTFYRTMQVTGDNVHIYRAKDI